MWDALGSTYLEAAGKALPLHRALLFFFGFIASLLICADCTLSVIQAVLRLEIKPLIFLDSEIYKGATILNLLAGCAAAVTAVVLSRISLRITFSAICKLINYEQRVDSAFRDSPFKTSPLKERKEALDFLEIGAAPLRNKLQFFNTVTELLSGAALVLLIAAFWGTWIDALAGFFLLMGLFIVQAFSIHLFLSQYLPIAISRAQLLGKPIPRATDID